MRLTHKRRKMYGKDIDCTVCGMEYDIRQVMKHPFLSVLVCVTCHSKLVTTFYFKETDGNEDKCKWFGDDSKELFCCDTCSSCISKEAIKKNFGMDLVQKIDKASSYQCLLCDSKPLKLLQKEYAEVKKKQMKEQLIYFHTVHKNVPYNVSSMRQTIKAPAKEYKQLQIDSNNIGSRRVGEKLMVEWEPGMFVEGKIDTVNIHRVLIKYVHKDLPSEYILINDKRLHTLEGNHDEDFKKVEEHTRFGFWKKREKIKYDDSEHIKIKQFFQKTKNETPLIPFFNGLAASCWTEGL